MFKATLLFKVLITVNVALGRDVNSYLFRVEHDDDIDVVHMLTLNMVNCFIGYYIPRIQRIGGCYGFTSKPPAARNGVNGITQKPRDGLFSNLVYTLVVIVSWPD